jgi:DNA-binding GntR family transcriptional regulator
MSIRKLVSRHKKKPNPRRGRRTKPVKPPRSDRIRRAIEKDILSGKLMPGAKLDEDAIAVRHSASRTPVREALRHLTSRKLVELRPNVGAFVAALSLVELTEMFETMAFLEAACAALAARRHTADDRRDLKAAHQKCAEAARRNNPDAFNEANAIFHESVYAASHNQYLIQETLNLRNRLEAYRRRATFHEGLISLTMGEHERILNAILTMNEPEAADAMRGHLDTMRHDALSLAMRIPKRVS